MGLLLGCIADDHTGATDLGAMLARAGMRVQLVFGVPTLPIDAGGYDAVILALKSRSLPAAEAIEQSLAAHAALRNAGAERFFFKYCSTFDSTDEGNIGPVSETLADALGAEQVLFCPAFPENGRTVYSGCLFVHGEPLNESGMADHPLNPMTDANLVRTLQRQSRAQVGLLSYETIEAGGEAIDVALADRLSGGERLVITDALQASHLRAVARAAADHELLTGGSAIAGALAEVLLARDQRSAESATQLKSPPGHTVVIAGSCSQATRRQVARFQEIAPSIRVDPRQLASGEIRVAEIVQQAAGHLASGSVLVYSTADPEAIQTAHQQLGREAACRLIEESLASIAAGLVKQGVRRLVVAGGETSGAVTKALGVEAVRIGPEIAPGVPWTQTLGDPSLAIALKSGNFGSDDFFQDALRLLP